MLHPSYTELIKIVNGESEDNDTPVVNSRYSIVMATAKRARQIIAGDANVTAHEASKPLSTAVKELNEGRIKIMPEQPEDEDDEALRAVLREEAALLGEVYQPEEGGTDEAQEEVHEEVQEKADEEE